jgi:hypothetical protein
MQEGQTMKLENYLDLALFIFAASIVLMDALCQ